MYTVKKYLMEIEVKGAMRSRVQFRLICVRLNTGVLRSAIAWVASAATNHWLALRCYSLIVEDIVTDGVSPERDLIAVSLDARFLVSIWSLPGVQLVRRTTENSARKNKEKHSEKKVENACGKTLQKVIPPTYRPPTEAHNITAGLWFSVVNPSLKHAHGIFQTLSLKLKANI